MQRYKTQAKGVGSQMPSGTQSLLGFKNCYAKSVMEDSPGNGMPLIGVTIHKLFI